MSAPRRLPKAAVLSSDESGLLLESIEDYAIFMLDPQGFVATWNLGAQKIKGYLPAEIIGEHFSRFYAEEEMRAGVCERVLLTALTEGRVEQEGWRFRKDGSRFWASVVMKPVYDATGTLLGFAKVTRDLTRRREAEKTARDLVREQAARAGAEQAEDRLRESEERYRALSRRLEIILDGVADGITVQDRSGKLMFANGAAAKTCGFSSAEELLEASLSEVVARFEILDEDGQPFDPEQLPGRRVLRGERPGSTVMHVRERLSGREWWSSVRASGVAGSDGKPELAINIWHDVTAERHRERSENYLAQATAALSSSLDYEAMLSTLASLLVPGLADWCAVRLVDGDELKTVAVAHVDPEKVAMARDLQDRYPPDRNSEHGPWQVLRTGSSELYEEVPDELLVKSARDGNHLQILRSLGIRSVVTSPICCRDRIAGTLSIVSAESGRRYNSEDVLLLAELGRRAGIAVENAQLYAGEKAAREQLALLARAGETLSDEFDYEETLRRIVRIVLPALGDFAFFEVVEGDQVRRVAAAHDDPEADELLGASESTSPAPWDEHLSALSSGESGFHPHIDEAWLGATALNPEQLSVLRKLRLCSMITVPIRTRGQLLGALTACFGKSGRQHGPDDVRLAEELARRAGIAVVQVRLYEAAQEAARAAQEASRVKDEFLATVSHELRTPLNAIVGWSSLLHNRRADPSIAKAIEVIHRNAQAQVKIIDDILDVSRITSGKLKLELKPADLVEIVRDAIEVIRPSAAMKQLSVEFRPATQLCLLVADSERLQQVVWNLLSNAIKFTETGGLIAIDLRQQGSSFVITVKDMGRGIEPEFLPFVFDRFRQADSSTTRRVGGLGLGLALVRHIVQLHGGQVEATSEGLAKGATFTVTLPVRAIEPLSPDRPPLEKSIAGRSLDSLRVLVVDDEADARELLRTVLFEAGGIVETAGSAHEAFELLQTFRPDVLVSDIGMPNEDGYAFMRRVRTLDTDAGGAVPSIALTAYTRAEEKRRALAVGFTTHIGKPVNPDDLLAAVGNLAQLSARRNER